MKTTITQCGGQPARIECEFDEDELADIVAEAIIAKAKASGVLDGFKIPDDGNVSFDPPEVARVVFQGHRVGKRGAA